MSALAIIAGDVAAAAAILRANLADSPAITDQLHELAEVLAVAIDQAARADEPLAVDWPPPPRSGSLAEAAALLQAAAARMPSARVSGRQWAKATLTTTAVATAIRAMATP